MMKRNIAKTDINDKYNHVKDNIKKRINNFQFTKKHILFILIFAALVFIGNRINFSAIVGSTNQSFTFFQFFGPIAGAFLGPIFGAISVLFAELADFLLTGKAFTPINIIRLTP